MSPAEELYDRDFYEWALRNAELLRTGRVSEADLAHIAEEIEDMGKSQRQQLENRLTVLLMHLLKFHMQPSRRSRSWRVTIRSQRIGIERLLKQNPSLRGKFCETLTEVYTDAVGLAADETGIRADAFPPVCPFTADQVLDTNYLPSATHPGS